MIDESAMNPLGGGGRRTRYEGRRTKDERKKKKDERKKR
jgi:hypothetical protein